MALTIELLDGKKHNRSVFSCGNDSLDNYIRRQASQDLKKKVAAVFVLIDSPNPDIIAYYTLSSYTVDITNLDEAFAKTIPRYPLLPATLLGRLAVDSTYQGQGIGELVLIDALKRVLNATTQIASVAVVVEAINEKAIKFYQKYGFRQFKEYPLKLYLPTKSIPNYRGSS
ncbi:GNAT family N-acetyltransferase [Aetokthonos hydrillicola Thurmond2011]|jgi:GNAT superfamily N-acetyltransferase|uniref:GNAT family N-acetyltransferase n=1 Tax=Aetokthonos hydrillicola Thurmond2011 TaxID=2712845 RepID=A0AAP5I9X4_9CYAN|nr:GNAT family N-acetyltransferase [Aetokthonos hydrillicola]MBW4586917.1 GNAT family N-acetyltransferase [Aetokthonos hydrillicola CCALA 1050]MDR9897608.1 GNAT family N-acetyltransferase [Aetokthonos hydrillicola Thurmond2011]